MNFKEEENVTLDDLVSVKIDKDYTDTVKRFLIGIRKQNRAKNSTLNILLRQSTKTVKNIVTDKKNLTHMVCFPKFWFEKWNNRNISITLKNQKVFINSIEGSDEILYKIGGTHYIKLNNNIYSALDYPRELQLEFFETYLVLTVTEPEKERIRIRKPQIEIQKKNEQMKQIYARMI